jgi:hypothetical protein
MLLATEVKGGMRISNAGLYLAARHIRVGLITVTYDFPGTGRTLASCGRVSP